MRGRLLTAYARKLTPLRTSPLEPGDLHSAVMSMASSYYLNYDMVFPPLNSTLVILQYTHALGLPGEAPAL